MYNSINFLLKFETLFVNKYHAKISLIISIIISIKNKHKNKT